MNKWLVLVAMISSYAVGWDHADAAWYKAESKRFVFYGTSPSALVEDAERLERFDALLRERFHIPSDTGEAKLEVYQLGTSKNP